MTCVAARIKNGRLTMAAESLTSFEDGGCVIGSDPKIVRYKHWGLVGHAGDCAGIAKCDDLWFGTIQQLELLASAMAERLKDSQSDTSYLLAYRGRLVCLYSDGGIVTMATPTGAIGSGGEAARAALLAGATPKKAVEIACLIRMDCGGPVICKSARL